MEISTIVMVHRAAAQAIGTTFAGVPMPVWYAAAIALGTLSGLGPMWAARRARRRAGAYPMGPPGPGFPPGAVPYPPISKRIFLSYRRADSQDVAGRLFEALWPRFGPQNVFIDVDSVRPGRDFVDAMLEAVESVDVVIAVIGRSWLSSTDSDGRRRLDDPHDSVRLEVETALRLGKQVIPVLVGGAGMPRAEELPAALAPLARRNAIGLSHTTFRGDLERLVVAIVTP
ncbi:toll/interleukin-1 receptor domain-containing protein [Cryptosporangium sp. NPDC051539]|uniref:toll/interleukin-1 receptor domain-containing protein n=1 Tax=Cryptosporangium sp. NPDC051539 TaxID=3363962 RepID=UPI0037B96886